MASKRFKQIFLVRFFTYFSIITGLVMILAQFGPVLSVELNYRLDQVTGKKHKLAQIVITSQGQTQVVRSHLRLRRIRRAKGRLGVLGRLEKATSQLLNLFQQNLGWLSKKSMLTPK